MAFISEIHYQNGYAGSSGVAEFVEVTLSPAEYARASDFNLTTYQTDGSMRETFNLGALTPTLDPDTGHYVYVMETPVTSPDHTSGTNEAEAVALTDSTLSSPISFVDIGGGTTDITATDGPATGATSTNVANASGGNSIQWDYYGNRIDGTLDSGSSVVCLTNGTLIQTPEGPRLIEDLRVGDLVCTRDSGDQALRFIHSKTLGPLELWENPSLRPVELPANAIAPNRPDRPLRVSPQHRMLVSGFRVETSFGTDQALVKAKDIAAHSDKAWVILPKEGITYFHLLFAKHEIILANNAETESFYPGPEALAALDPEERRELSLLFPALLGESGVYQAGPHPTLKSWESRLIWQ